MSDENVETVEIMPNVTGFLDAMARTAVHSRSEWEQAVARVQSVLGRAPDDLAALLRTLPTSGWTPADAVAFAELIQSQPERTTTHGLHVTREQVERARLDKWHRPG